MLNVMSGEESGFEERIKWKYDYSKKGFYDESGNRHDFTFDPDTEIFTTSNGVQLKIERIGQYLLNDFQARFAERFEPEPPMRRIEVETGKYIEEPNIEDSAFKLKYARFMEKSQLALLRFLIVHSVEIVSNHKPDAKIERIVKAFGYSEGDPEYDEQVKYAFIQKAVGNDEQESTAFFVALKGRSMLTEHGIKTSEARFQNADSGN